jgi:hypothetical protein
MQRRLRVPLQPPANSYRWAGSWPVRDGRLDGRRRESAKGPSAILDGIDDNPRPQHASPPPADPPGLARRPTTCEPAPCAPVPGPVTRLPPHCGAGMRASLCSSRLTPCPTPAAARLDRLAFLSLLSRPGRCWPGESRRGPRRRTRAAVGSWRTVSASTRSDGLQVRPSAPDPVAHLDPLWGIDDDGQRAVVADQEGLAA